VKKDEDRRGGLGLKGWYAVLSNIQATIPIIFTKEEFYGTGFLQARGENKKG
jgi:hypothetical protein